MITKKTLRMNKIILKVKRTKARSLSLKKIKAVKIKMSSKKKISQKKTTAIMNSNQILKMHIKNLKMKHLEMDGNPCLI